MGRYVLRSGLAPIPRIGEGPLDEAEYLAREARYMTQFEEGAPTPRDRGIYVLEDEPQAPAKRRGKKADPEPEAAPEDAQDETQPADDAPGEEQ